MPGKPLVDDRKRDVEASLEKGEDRRVGRRRRKTFQKPIGPEKPAHFLVVEDDPAQRFEPLVFSLRLEFAGAFSEIGQANRGLAQLPLPVREHRRLAHFIDRRPVFRGARFALAEEVDEDRTPVSADQAQHISATR
jgi:hypothetical protein